RSDDFPNNARRQHLVCYLQLSDSLWRTRQRSAGMQAVHAPVHDRYWRDRERCAMPCSSLPNEILQDVFDGPSFTLPDITTPNGPHLSSRRGIPDGERGLAWWPVHLSMQRPASKTCHARRICSLISVALDYIARPVAPRTPIQNSCPWRRFLRISRQLQLRASNREVGSAVPAQM
ncbi:MAG: hypothetical protein QOJ42_4254, partial [Acidobacteriaceae bacterium]|nr:hypothetical protein [Acidobacteriaceae bacterium]